MLIQGERIHVVPFESEHLNDPKYFAWLNDIDVVRYLGRDEYLEPIPFAEVQEYVGEVWASKYCSFLAVYHSDGNHFIGTAKINYLNDRGLKNKVADIGIMIGEREYWGKGLATDVLRSISHYAFDSMGVRKLTAGAMSPNVAVLRAFERIGYIEEARLRRHLSVGDLEYCDHVLLGCFKEELLSA
jgi:RimJ/RimL family protein N-acetyltransferase